MSGIKISLITIAVLGMALALPNLASAQDAGKQPKRGASVEQQLERMTKQLDLTDAQKPKVKAELEETTKKRQALMDEGVTGRERREKAMALVEAQDKKMKEILTSDQWDKYQKQREEMRNRAKAKGAPGDGKKKNQ